MNIQRLRVKRVDLVQMGASYDPTTGTGARVVLFKAADMKPCKACGAAMGKDDSVCPKCGAKAAMATPYKEAKMFDPKTLPAEAQEYVAGLSKSVETLTAQVAALTKAAEEKKAPPPAEDVLKGASPEIRALLEKAQADSAAAQKKADEATAAIAKMEDDRRMREVTERVNKEFKHAAGKSAADLAKALKNIGDRCPEDVKVIEAVLKTSSALISESDALKTFGTDAGDGGGVSPVERVNALVAEKLEKKVAKDGAEALAMVMREHPALYNAYRAAASQRVGRTQVGQA